MKASSLTSCNICSISWIRISKSLSNS